MNRPESLIAIAPLVAAAGLSFASTAEAKQTPEQVAAEARNITLMQPVAQKVGADVLRLYRTTADDPAVRHKVTIIRNGDRKIALDIPITDDATQSVGLYAFTATMRNHNGKLDPATTRRVTAETDYAPLSDTSGHYTSFPFHFQITANNKYLYPRTVKEPKHKVWSLGASYQLPESQAITDPTTGDIFDQRLCDFASVGDDGEVIPIRTRPFNDIIALARLTIKEATIKAPIPESITPPKDFCGVPDKPGM